MNDRAGWETPELERLGHAADAQSGTQQHANVEVVDSSPSGPV